jgi:hypothetical protein
MTVNADNPFQITNIHDTSLFTESEIRAYETLKPLGIIRVPYAFVLGGVNFAGYVGVNTTNPQDTYTEGAFAGLVVCDYFLNRNRSEVCCNGVGIRACINLDISSKKLIGSAYYRKINCDFSGCSAKWASVGEETLASW